jgi:hypothetical protein
MKKNMGNIDRIARVIIAIIFAVLYFTRVVTGIPGIIMLILGAVFVLTAVIRSCPLYLPFGISTRKRE